MKFFARIGLILSIVVVAWTPASVAGPGGGSEGVDIMPSLVAIDVPGDESMVTVDGRSWHAVLDSEVQGYVDSAGVSSVVDMGDVGTLLEVGASGLGEEVAAILMAAPSRAASLTAPDTHPKPEADEYRLKKTITTSKGEKKDIFKTRRVERRAGESAKDFSARSERALRDALDDGWESIP